MDDQIVGTESGSVDTGSGGAPAPAPVPPTAPTTPSPEFELTWNGKVQRVPTERARELAQMGYDYTQKMQKLAEDRRGWEGERTQYEQALQEVRAFLEDRARVEAYIRQQWGQGGTAAPPATPADPFAPEPAPLSREDAQKMLEAERQQILASTQQFTAQQLAQLRVQAQVDSLRQTYDADLAATIDGLTAQHPELRMIPQLSRMLKEEVAKMEPRTIEEAKIFMREVAVRQAAQMQEFLAEERKKALPSPALTNGIEPPGGSGPMPVTPRPGTFKKISDPAFKASIVQDMERLMRNGPGTGA